MAKRGGPWQKCRWKVFENFWKGSQQESMHAQRMLDLAQQASSLPMAQHLHMATKAVCLNVSMQRCLRVKSGVH